MSALCHKCGTQIDEDELTLCGSCSKNSSASIPLKELDNPYRESDGAYSKICHHAWDKGYTAALSQVIPEIERIQNKIRDAIANLQQDTPFVRDALDCLFDVLIPTPEAKK